MYETNLVVHHRTPFGYRFFLAYSLVWIVVFMNLSCRCGADIPPPSNLMTEVGFMHEDQSNNFTSRAELLKRLLSDQFDVLVIGGGATGAGAALEAASRGLRVALIEAHDFSFGTSSRSTKLIHGGVRYLENAVKKLDYQEYALVRDALAERKNFLHNAPHLSKPLPIITPVYSWFAAGYYLIGLKLYDFLAGSSSLGSSKFISKEEALQQFPKLKQKALKGAVLYYDGQFDDARMNIALILTAIRKGAVALNYVRLINLEKDQGIINGAIIIDEETKETHRISARMIINATGTYADQVRRLDNPDASNIMIPSQGSHIILSPKFVPPQSGMVIPKTKDGRVLFVLPWLDKTMVGTTDEPQAIVDLPKATHEEIAYILKHVADYYEEPIQESDIIATWSGFRPLAKPSSTTQNTASISRDHVIEVSPSNLITIVGGKWTTYRIMGEDVINTAISVGQLKAKNDSVTKYLKLVGAAFYKDDLAQELTHYENLAPDIAHHLAASYGDRVDELLNVHEKFGRTRLVDGYPFIEAEVIYAVQHEYAVHATDVLARRLRLGFLDNRAAQMALPRVVAIMAFALGWDDVKVRQELNDGLTFLATMITTKP